MIRLAEKGMRLEFWVALVVIGALAGLLLRSLSETADRALMAQARQAEVVLRSAVQGIHRVWQLQGQPLWAGPLQAPDGLSGRPDARVRWYVKMNGQGWPVDARTDVEGLTVAAQPCARLWQALWVSPEMRFAGVQVQVRTLEKGCRFELPAGVLIYRSDRGEVTLKRQVP